MRVSKLRAIALASSGLVLVTAANYEAAAQSNDADAASGNGTQGSETAVADAPPASDGTEPVIIVSGVRQQLIESAQLERQADNIVSVITADDLGEFPDETFAESVARLPGVTLIEEEGEGRFVRIRGLSEDFSQVTLNNAQLGSSDANGNRSVALDVVPSDLFQRAEVGKTLFPDTDHDSLGAKLDLRPLSAFDRSSKQQFRASVQGTYSEDGDLISPNANANYTRRIDAGSGEFGIAVGLSYSERDVFGSRIRSQSGDGIDNRDAPAVEGAERIFVPAELDTRIERGVRERIGGIITLDFENDTSRYQLGGIFGQLKDDDRRYAQEVEFRDASGNETVNELVGSARFSDIDIERQVFFLASEERTWAIHFEGENRFADDAWVLSYALDYSRNDFEINDGKRAQWQLNAAARDDSVVDAVWGKDFGDFTYVGNGDLDGSFDLNYRPTMRDFRLNSLLIIEEDRSDEVYSGNIDLARRLDLFDRPAAIKIGAKYRDRKRNFARGEFSQGLSSSQLNALDDAGIPTRLDDQDPNIDLVVPETRYAVNGGVDGLDSFLSFSASERLLDSLIDQLALEPTQARADFSATEETWAAYAMATIDLTSDLRLVTGVRYENTRYAATGQTIQNAEIAFLDGIDGNGDPIEGEELFGRSATGQQGLIETITNNYDGFFPAAHLRWDATDDLVVRLSLSRAQVRPSYGDANALTENVYRFTEPAFARLDEPGSCTQTITVPIDGVNREFCDRYVIESRGGNPVLRPTRANQIDFNVGWYPNKRTNMTFAFFYKDLSDVFIEVETGNQEIIAQLNPLDAIDPLTGLPVTRLTKVVNASDGYVYGFELAGNHSFTYLPGPLKHIFIDANIAILRGKTSSFAVREGESFELPDQPRLIGNLGIGYEDKKFLLRASMDYRDELLRSVNATNAARDIFSAERFRLGFSTRYSVNENLRLFANVSNVTDEIFNAFYRSDAVSGPIFEEVEAFGRTWRVGANLRF